MNIDELRLSVSEYGVAHILDGEGKTLLVANLGFLTSRDPKRQDRLGVHVSAYGDGGYPVFWALDDAELAAAVRARIPKEHGGTAE